LGLDYIDQYLLHAPLGGKVLECYDLLLEYQRNGKIKTVGVSNFGVKHLEAIKHSGRPLPQVNQIELHPWCTNEDIVKWCRENNVALVAYCPLARTQYFNDSLLNELCKKYNKTQSQILVRWSLQMGFIPIPKTSKINRLIENANVFDFEIDPSDMARMRELGKEKKNVDWDPTISFGGFGPTH
jgi:diketogulonate reductase-like aldo/keto reductase